MVTTQKCHHLRGLVEELTKTKKLKELKLAESGRQPGKDLIEGNANELVLARIVHITAWYLTSWAKRA